MDPVRRTYILGQRYLDGFATAAELAELEQMLQSDPVAADVFARLSRLEADLSAQFSEEPLRLREAAVLEAIERDQRRRRWWGRGLRLAVAASLLLLLSGSLLWWFNQPAPVVPQLAGNVVLEGEVLVDGHAVEHLDDGVPLLVAGPAPALLRLSDGSRAQLEPASEAVVHGASEGVAQRLELMEGAGRFTVLRAREPFLVDTPAGSVSAEDSEFTVKLSKTESGDPQMKLKRSLLAVMVLSGLAQVETDQNYRLEAGERRVFAFQRDAGNAKPVWFVVERREENGIFAQPRIGARAYANGLVFGIVSEVKENKLTVSFGRRSSPTQETFDVSPSVKVFVDGKPAKLAGLAKGTLVRVQKNDAGELVAIMTEGPTVSGRVKAVAAGKITLEGRGRAPVLENDMEYAVPPDAKVLIDRQPGKITDVKPGHGVILKLSIDRKSALVITSMGPPGRRPVQVLGEIKAIDARAGTVVLSGIRGGNERTFTLIKDVRVVIDGRPATLDDLKLGKSVALRLDREGKAVEAINVIGVLRPLLHFLAGDVSEVKGSKLTVTLGRRDPHAQKTFEAGDSVKVFVDGKPAKLADLARGMTVQLGQDDKDALVTVRAEGPTIPGKVKEISADKITLQTPREESSYTISPDVRVIIDRQPAKLAQIKPDMEVVLKLSVDGKTVLAITRLEVRRLVRGEQPIGKIKSLDLKGKTITLIELRGEGEKTFTLAREVRVVIDGQPGKLEDVKVGSIVVLVVNPDGIVQGIAVRSAPRGDGRRAGERSKWSSRSA